MAQLFAFLNEANFDQYATRAMGEAYDKALSLAPAGTAKDVLAKLILAHAQQGERDPERLCDAALSALGSVYKSGITAPG